MENINIKVILDEVFGKTQEDIIKLVTKDGFELDWLINRWIV